MAHDAVVLSFHDCLLYESDVNRLARGHWLNDSLIEFAFEYFSRVMFERAGARYLFVPPGTTQFLKLVAPSEMAVVLDPLSFNSRSLTFLALNDNADPSEAGGTHWSLLVYCHESASAFHFDSMARSNHADALRLASSLSVYVGQQVKVAEVMCPKQTNACDCGVYVICFAQKIAQHFACGKSICAKELELAVRDLTPTQAEDMRLQLKQWIGELVSSCLKT